MSAEKDTKNDNLSEDELLEFNYDFVGLDTIEWRLEKGNLAIQQEVENFIEYLKKKNGVTP